ncbi:cytidylyltransferase domain-containing protein [Evansella cellulosilytica]|uniref:Acylneuraminate cytidylyltransferase n=1 Tax=Evansella cellulosilytica (strain ATCC 21833 / DSM 2522 / FERM P-1141 / JCM 9156 / N-4) TaxID=649639 RepID=E6TS79_EVAC2|nr:glycosyltransferase family protein [Evansella cellulosilytica]ADU31848.1 acylneuraminate cytidylyltransferase [Evansella cellulosilytica DSM 2522]
MKVNIIIQARMGSSRLPGKVLKPLGNSIVLDYVVSRCKRIKGVDEVIVATTISKQDADIEKWCQRNRVNCFRGSELDVLDRYYKCAKLYQSDYIIRVTSDCPFVDIEMAENIIKKMINNPCDFVKVEGDLPRGLVVEMFAFNALEYIYKNGKEERHREHVTYYGYENEDKFSVKKYFAPDSLCNPELRITLDTVEDYELCKMIAQHFNNDKLVSSNQVVNFLVNNPEVANINSHIVQKPVK